MSTYVSERQRFHFGRGQSRALALAMLTIALSGESAALAYIDPATSGTLMQIIAPILLAIGVLWQRIMHVLRLVAQRIRRAVGRDDRA